MVIQPRSLLKPLMLFICLSFCFWTGCKSGFDSDDNGLASGNMTGFRSNQELESYLKSQYLKSVHTDYPVVLETRAARGNGALDEAGNVPESTPNAFSPEDPEDYTGVNLQEAGVDESDLVRTDGEYFYIASNDVLNIVRAADPLSVVGRIALEETIDSMYLYGDLLLLLYSPAGYGGSPWIDPATPGIDTVGIPYWIPTRSKVGIAFFDVSDPSAPNELKRVEADGHLVSSRRIDNYLYVVQQFLPELPAPDVLETRIRNMELEDLIPFYTETGGAQDDGQPSQVVAAADFYHPEIDGGGSIVSIMAFDLDDPDFSFSSTGAVADASIVYATAEALYFTSTYWNYSGRAFESPREQTVVYKFKLEGDRVTGQGYAGVDGRVLNQFSLGEYEGVLRIATTTGWSGATNADSMNHVFCLRSENGTLKVIGRLKNLAPGEEIYAARFIGLRGYLVTFVTIDPLFVLDLSDPTAPEVAGELKIPGYSAYIHPYGDNYLLCIGKDAVDDDGFAWYQGVQLSIFDVSNISDPVLLHKAVIGDRGTSSDALYNHKAFTFRGTDGLLAVPIALYEHRIPPAYPYSFGEFTFSGLYVYRVTTAGGFDFIGRISTMPDAQQGGYYYPWTRGVFVGENVYAVTPDSVHSARTEDIEGTVQRLLLAGE